MIKNEQKHEILETINLKALVKFHVLIWIIFSIKNGILWYYLEPENLGLIIKYKIYEFCVLGGLSSYIIILLFRVVIRVSKNKYHLIVGYLASVFISLSFYIIVTGISFNAIILSRLQLFDLESYLKGLTFYLFLFTLLNLPAYFLAFGHKYKEQVLTNRHLLFNQKKREEEEKKELADKVFLSNRHMPSYIDLSAIKYIQADAYISHVFTSKNKKITLDRSLKKWEDKLSPKRFTRIHKSFIVNTDYITRIEKLPNHTYQIYIKNSDTVLNMSRRFGKNFISNPQYQHFFNHLSDF